MASLRAHIIKFFMRSLKKRSRKMMSNFSSFRLEKEKIFARISPPRNYKAQPLEIEGIEAEWLEPKGYVEKDSVLFYLHGGGFATGSIRSHRGLVAQFSNATGLRALSINYRLAPENPFPAGMQDALKVYRHLLEQYKPEQIVVMGDSAGGGLAASMLLQAREEGLPAPLAVVLLSPWVDMSLGGESMETLKHKDPILPADIARDWAKWYIGDADPKNPILSPVFASWRDYPAAVLLHVGTEEILFSDSENLYKKMREEGLDIEYYVGRGLTHVWHMSWRFLPEGKQSIKDIGNFVAKQIAARDAKKEKQETAT